MHAIPAKPGLGATVRRWLGGISRRLAPASPELSAADFEGGLIVNSKSISAVAIGNIAEVMSHHVFRAIGGTSHVVRFIGGGELRYPCDDKGQVIAMSATGVRSEVSAQHVLTVAAYNER